MTRGDLLLRQLAITVKVKDQRHIRLAGEILLIRMSYNPVYIGLISCFVSLSSSSKKKCS